MYEHVRDEKYRRRFARDPMPNRHAAKHGLVVYPSMQNGLNTLLMDDLPLPVVILLAASNRPDDLRPLVPKVTGVLSGTLQRRVYHVSAAVPGG